MVPTVHANFRYLEKGDAAWFGGGTDLTPYYPYSEDAVHFHRRSKPSASGTTPNTTPDSRNGATNISFSNIGAKRGEWAVFSSTMLRVTGKRISRLFPNLGTRFSPPMFLVVRRRIGETYTDRERQYQLYRRGRYVEFNLLYDRGTIFGLETRGRTESILMSLPPLVRWVYDFKPEPGSLEERNMEFYKPREWV